MLPSAHWWSSASSLVKPIYHLFMTLSSDSSPDVDEEPDANVAESRRIQRRTLVVLSSSLVLGGFGIAGAVTAGGLLVAQVSGSDSFAGLGQTAIVLGGAALAVPLAQLSSRRGRRAGLTGGYAAGLVGALAVVAGAAADSLLFVLVGLTVFGGAQASGLQARFAATDLSAPSHMSRDLSIVMWMSAVGAVIGPNLANPATATAEWLGLPALSGMFLWAAAGFLLAVVLLTLTLHPDPLLRARKLSGDHRTDSRSHSHGLWETFRVIRSSKPASLSLVAVVTANATMIGLMVMTPLHLNHGGSGLAIVGIVISVHVAGMYLFSPLVGILADAVGQVRVIGMGAVLLGAAGLVAAMAPASAVVLVGIALFLLGIGWSFCIVAGSSLLTASLSLEIRPSAQGLTDLSMGMAGALAGALAGVVFGVWSYAALGLVVAALVLPLTIVTLRGMRHAKSPGASGSKLAS